jgi:hypothetical protein
MVSNWNCLKYFCALFLYYNHQVHRNILITLYVLADCTNSKVSHHISSVELQIRFFLHGLLTHIGMMFTASCTATFWPCAVPTLHSRYSKRGSRIESWKAKMLRGSLPPCRHIYRPLAQILSVSSMWVCQLSAVGHTQTHRQQLHSTTGMSNRGSPEGHMGHMCVVMRATHDMRPAGRMSDMPDREYVFFIQNFFYTWKLSIISKWKKNSE